MRAATCLALFAMVLRAAPVAAQLLPDAAYVVDKTDAPGGRHEGAICSLKGKIFIIGGRGENNVYGYNDLTGIWEDYGRPGIQGEIHHFQCFTLGSKIIISGALTGKYPREPPLKELYSFDPRKRTWDVIGSFPDGRERGAAGGFTRKRLIYYVGGSVYGHGRNPDTKSNNTVTWFDRFDKKSGSWEVLSDFTYRRDHYGAVYMRRDDAVYLVGGRNTGERQFAAVENAVKQLERYQFADKSQRFSAGTWEVLPAVLATGHPGMTPAKLNQYIFIGDGEVKGLTNQNSSKIEVYDTRKQTFVFVEKLPKFEDRHGTGYVQCNRTIFTAAGAYRRGDGNREFKGTQALYLDGTPRICVPKTAFWE